VIGERDQAAGPGSETFLNFKGPWTAPQAGGSSELCATWLGGIGRRRSPECKWKRSSPGGAVGGDAAMLKQAC